LTGGYADWSAGGDGFLNDNARVAIAHKKVHGATARSSAAGGRAPQRRDRT